MELDIRASFTRTHTSTKNSNVHKIKYVGTSEYFLLNRVQINAEPIHGFYVNPYPANVENRVSS